MNKLIDQMAEEMATIVVLSVVIFYLWPNIIVLNEKALSLWAAILTMMNGT